MEYLSDHGPLIKELKSCEHIFSSFSFGDGKGARRVGFSKKKERVSSVVLAEETGLELGAPRSSSIVQALWTRTPGVVQNRLYVAGEVTESPGGESLPLLMLVAMELPESLDPHTPSLFSLMNLTNRLPKVMTRTIPGRLWVRVHKRLSRKFSLYGFGQAVRAAYSHRFPQLENMDVYLAAGEAALHEPLKNIALASSALSGENRKLRLESDGVLSCDDLDCNVCDQKPTCDTLREVIALRRRQ